MLLIGLWHGGTWNFIVWGLWHGLGLWGRGGTGHRSHHLRRGVHADPDHLGELPARIALLSQESAQDQAIGVTAGLETIPLFIREGSPLITVLVK